MDEGIIARFWPKVDKTDTCWLWTASRMSGGYGAFSWGGRTSGAHRFAYEAFVGGIPEGLEIDHTCHEPRCVNPEHLKATTKTQNQQNRKGATVASKSGIRGVIPASGSTWIARVYVAGIPHDDGPFVTKGEAAVAVVRLRNRLMTNNRLDAR